MVVCTSILSVLTKMLVRGLHVVQVIDLKNQCVLVLILSFVSVVCMGSTPSHANFSVILQGIMKYFSCYEDHYFVSIQIQYVSIFDLVLHFLDSFSIYSNFK